MKVTIGCLGREVSIEPFVAIALALRDRGHDVTIAGSADGAAEIEAWRFPIEYIAGDIQAFLRDPHVVRHVMRRGLLAACVAADVILLPSILIAETLTLADVLRKPVVIVAETPSLPASSHVSQPFIAAKPLPFPVLTRFTHAIYDRRISTGLRHTDDAEWRMLLGQRRVRGGFIREAIRRRVPQIHAYSTSLFPRPADWPGFVETSGRIALTPARKFAAGMGRLGPALVNWLDAGPPPVALVVSDLCDGGSQARLGLAKQLTQTLGARVVVAVEGLPDGPHPDDENIFVSVDADNDQLFPRCRAIVHNGTAGATGQAARAGVPAVICSTYGDQRMWGERLRALGIGEHLPFRKLNSSRLSQALKRLDRSAVQKRARDIGSRVHAEDGIPAAVALVERLHHDVDPHSRSRSNSATAR